MAIKGRPRRCQSRGSLGTLSPYGRPSPLTTNHVRVYPGHFFLLALPAVVVERARSDSLMHGFLCGNASPHYSTALRVLRPPSATALRHPADVVLLSREPSRVPFAPSSTISSIFSIFLPAKLRPAFIGETERPDTIQGDDDRSILPSPRFDS